MPKIKLLDENTACRIAAGEVVERPVSVVKELVENSLDAGADSVTITVEGGGTSLISVVDNGCGISQEDTPLAFQRHATSKISSDGDLDRIRTLGFRGEALPGIAAVSDLVIKTRVRDCHEGCMMHIRGGSVMALEPVGCPAGTAIEVRDLFFNTPARRKHLKSQSTEGGLVADLVYKLALVRPGVRFTMLFKGREIFRSPGSGKLLDALASVYGLDAAGMMMPVHSADGNVFLGGYVAKPQLNRSTRQHITVAVNGRLVRSAAINQALDEAYRGLITVGRYPLAVLVIDIPAENIDVNIHPAKTEIRMENEDRVAQLVTDAVRNALREANLVPAAGSTGRVKTGMPRSSEPYTLHLDPGGLYAGKTAQGKPSPGGEINTESDEAAPSPAVRAEEPPNRLRTGEQYQDKIQANPDDALSACAVRESGPAVGYPGASAAETPAREIVDPADADRWRTGDAASREEERFPHLQVVGQLLNLYIVCQDGEEIYLVDQHAAHERVLFEKFYRRLVTNSPEVQYLLAPLTVNLRAHEKEMLRDYRDQLTAMGFVLEDFGRDSLLLRGVPADCSPGESERLINDLVETIMAQGKTGTAGIKFALSALLACKAAIKAGERLTPPAMQSLLEQLACCAEPFTCPHGRPTMVSLSRKELDAMFKRG